MIAVLASLAVSAPAAEPRTWTNVEGRTIEATYIRVDGDVVVLSLNGDPVRVPISQLSEPDQQWVRGQISGGGESTAELGDESAADSSADEPADDSQTLDRIRLKTKRVWTDDRNNQITAEFIRVHQRNVVLNQNGRIQMLPFDKFAADDQDYIKRLLRSRDEHELADALDRMPPAQIASARPDAAHMLPEVPSPPAMSFSIPPSPANAARDHLNQMMARQQEASRKMQEDLERSRQEAAERMRQIEEDRRQRDEERRQRDEQRRQQHAQQLAEIQRQREQYAQPRPSSSPRTGTEYASTTYPSNAGTPYPAASPSSPAPSAPSYSISDDLWQEDVGVCSACNREVSGQYGAGDRCPHCNAYFDYEEREDGSRQYAAGSSESSSNFRFTGRSIRGLLSLGALVVGLAIAGARKLLS